MLVWPTLMLLMSCLCTTAWAEKNSDRDLNLDIDQPPETRHMLAPNWRYGVELQIDAEWTRELDLDSREDDDTLAVEPQLEAALAFTPNERVFGFLDLELVKLYLPETPAGSTSLSTRLDVKELYVTLRDLYPGFSLQLGRSNFEDERQWLYDEELDGRRVYLFDNQVIYELSANRLNWLPRDLLDATVDERVNNYFALTHLPYPDESKTTLYLLARDDRKPNGEDLLFAGVQSLGELGSRIDYWLDAALVVGKDDANDVVGQGFDLGASYTFDVTWEPAVTAGLAFGSGDAGPGDPDRNFRQTGLQENEGEFTGVASFQYYGEVLDPELSNLMIFTFGLGVHPSEWSSIDLVYHYYRQNKAVDELRDTNLETDPDGVHRELGQAVDLIVGHQQKEEFELKLILGQFFPGSAFSDDASAAFFGRFEMKYQF